MSESKTSVICIKCHYEFEDPTRKMPCPNCGSLEQSIHVLVRDEARGRDSLSLEQRQKGWPGFLRRIIDRWKLSRQGKEAREVLAIDRSDFDKTVKRHLVEEFENGEWKIVHDEYEEFPAKRRPSK